MGGAILVAALATSCGGGAGSSESPPPPPTYTVGGAVSGLGGAGLALTLAHGGASEVLAIGADGPFAFDARLGAGVAWEVSVSAQPAGQVCAVAGGAGTMATAAVTSVAVTCAALGATFTVGGTVAGLGPGATLELVLGHDGSSEPLAIAADGPFTFAAALAPGVAWEVDVSVQPAGQACTVVNASGTVSGANVTWVGVTCRTLRAIGGTVTGLSGGAVTLRNAPAADEVTVSVDGPFSFGVKVPDQGTYDVTVVTQPGGRSCLVAGGAGVVAGADVTSVQVTCTALQPLAGALYAGNMGGAGNADGTGPEARFHFPTGMGAGLVADTYNNRLRSVSDDGTVVTVTGSNPTSADGPLAGTYFQTPEAIAEGPGGVAWVAESGRNRIRKIEAGVVTTVAGSLPAGSADGPGSSARFDHPAGIAVDPAGVVYVADTFNHTIRRISPSGDVTTLAGVAGQLGRDDGPGAAARFFYPTALALTPSGDLLYVADSGNKLLRSVTPAGEVFTVAGSTAGFLDSGDPLQAKFQSLDGLAIDGAGAVYVADGQNAVIRRLSGLGVETFAGVPHTPGSDDGAPQLARFNLPVGLTFRGGDLWVSDNNNHTLRKISAGGAVTTPAGLAPEAVSRDGSVEIARFVAPVGIALGASPGELFVTDRYFAKVRQVHPDVLGGGASSVSTHSGSGLVGSNDGLAGAARFNEPGGVSALGRWVADTGNRLLRGLGTDGAAVTAAGAAGAAGVVDGVGSAARFLGPYDAWEAPSGLVYLADAHAVRRYDPVTGEVTTIAGGSSAGFADGAGSAARLRGAEGLTGDADGNLYVADTGNHALRLVTPAGVVTTLAGGGFAGHADGPVASALFREPTDVARAADGTLYVADQGNRCIRAISPSGTVTTLVGTPGITGFSPGATPSAIGPPRKLALDGNVLYVTMLQGVARFVIAPP